MNYDNSTLLIGLKDNVDVQSILIDLHNVKGFIRVIEEYHLTNAALIEIDPNYYEQAFQHIRTLEIIIEYVERNAIIYPASFERTTDFNLFSQHCYRENIYNLHQVIPDSLDGKCVRIALIDTGISPHPYLPAVSYYEMIKRNDLYFNQYLTDYAKIYFDDLVRIEKDPQTGLFTSHSSKAVVKDYRDKARHKTDDYRDAVMKDWAPIADKWYKDSLQKSQLLKIPDLQLYPKFYGYFRRISPLSYNFIDDNLDVTDVDNHGTLMAGIISGRSWIKHHITEKSIYERAMNYEFDIHGLSPYSELLVIKAFEKKKDNKNWVSTLLSAIQYAFDNRADIIYIGLAAPQSERNIPGRSYQILNNMISQCHNSDIPVICPAGNASPDKVGTAGLAFPAACDNAWAISSVYLKDQYSKVEFSPHSHWADRGLLEAVSFAAFGGDDNCKMLTTSLNYGFELVVGTSTAAAIATGIFARFLSKKYIEQINGKHTKFMTNSVYIDKKPPSNLMPVDFKPNKIPIADIHSKAQSNCDKSLKTSQSGLPDVKVGYGILRTMK